VRRYFSIEVIDANAAFGLIKAIEAVAKSSPVYIVRRGGE